MSAIGTLGHLDVTVTANTKQAEAGLKMVGAVSDQAAMKMKAAARVADLMGPSFTRAGEQSAAAARVQENAAERARRAWQRELIQQDRAAAAAAEMGRQQELAALKTDILTRSVEKQGGALAGLKDRLALTSRGVQLSARDWIGAFGPMGELLGFGLAAGMGVSKIKEIEASVNELGHLSDETGMKIQSLAGLQTIVRGIGADWDPIANGLVRLNRALAQVPYEATYARALAEIGVNLKELNPATTTAEERLQVLSEAFQKHAGTAAAADAAIELFGRGGAALIPILEAQGAALQANMQKQGQMTGITEQSGDAAQQWSQEWEQASVQVEAALMPIANNAAALLRDVTGGAALIVAAFRTAIDVIWDFNATLVRAWTLAAKLTIDLENRDYAGAIADARDAAQKVEQTWKGSAEAVGQQWQKAWHTFWDEPQVTKPPKGADIDTSTILPRNWVSTHMAAAKQALTEMEADHAMSLEDEANYWQKLADHVQKGSALYNAYLMEANKARAAIVKQQQKDWGDQVVALAKSDAPAAMAAGGTYSERAQSESASLYDTWHAGEDAAREQQKKLIAAAQEAFRQAEQERRERQKLAEERIRLAQESGRMTRQQAALALQTLHAEGFAQWSQASASFSSQFPNVAVPGAASTVGELELEAERDQAQVEATENLQEFTTGLARSAQELQQWGAKLAALFNQTLNSTNDQILNAMTGKRTTFSDVGSQFFRGIAKTTLENLEGRTMKMLGFGGGQKPDGTKANPFYVLDASQAPGQQGGSLTGIAGKVSSWFSSLFGGGVAGLGSISAGLGGTLSSGGLGAAPGMLDLGTGMSADDLSAILGSLSGFADGGPIPSGMPAIVGEAGPELFVPSSAGRIVPNHQLGGGDTHVHMNVDARGATDPAAVEAAAHRAVMRAAPQIAGMALAAHQDRQARRISARRM